MIKKIVGIFCLVFCISLESMQLKSMKSETRKKPEDCYKNTRVDLAIEYQKKLLDKQFNDAQVKSEEEFKKHMSNEDGRCNLF